jgi:DNA-binding HxlR family transcriptional regulator
VSDAPDAVNFDRSRAELFDALGHPVRIRILHALEDGPLGFSELRRKVGLESGGHLQFHLGKLDGLVMAAADSAYMLTDDGREALRIVNAMGDYAVLHKEERRAKGRVVISKGILVALVAGLVFLGSAAAYQQWELSAQQPEMVKNLMSYAYPASASVTSNATGLELSLNINATMITSGEAVAVSASEMNNLPSTSNVTSVPWVANGTSISWPFPGGEPFPQNHLYMPMFLSLYRGYYTAANVSFAQPLLILPPEITSGPQYSISNFVFQPLSDNASAFAYLRAVGSRTWEPWGNLWTDAVSGTATFSATYPDTNFDSRTLRTFSPSIYTIAAGDEWGQSVLLHFVVISAPTSNALWNALTSSPYLLILAVLVAACAGTSYFLLKRRALRRRQLDGLLEPAPFGVS